MGNPFIDSLIRAYLVGLGDYSTDSFSAQNSPLVWGLFILATIVTQLIFMNMLIAIMGDTYSKMSERIDQARLYETI